MSYRAVNNIHLSFKTQSVYVTYGKGRCLLWDKYEPFKYSVDWKYSSSFLILLLHQATRKV